MGVGQGPPVKRYFRGMNNLGSRDSRVVEATWGAGGVDMG